jgi:flagellar hook-associated protein FlgK
MKPIKNTTSIIDVLYRLETTIKEINISVCEIENRISDLEHQLTSDVDGMLDNVRSSIGDDIQSAVSEINSNTDQLKD